MFAAVAFNIGARQTFDYIVPEDCGGNILGKRVVAPLAKRQAAGVVLAARKTSEVPAARLRPLARVLDDMPPLPPATLKLIRFCAGYYHCPIGIAAAAALPRLFRRVSAYSPPTVLRLANAKQTPPPREKAKQIAAVLQKEGAMTSAALGAKVKNPAAEIKKLLADGFLSREPRPAFDGGEETKTKTVIPAPKLTDEQKEVLQNIETGNGFSPHLLLGATGSGKSETYLRLAEKIISENKQALILVPEIRLTPQLAQNARDRLPRAKLCVLHSGLSDGERAARWLCAARGEADVVLGTRSAVFAPMPRLGLIVVDEEHDDSYKQQGGFSFSARDIAVWRARAEKVPHLAASATPSLESYQNAKRGRYRFLQLHKRLHSSPPKPELIDLGNCAQYHGISAPLLDAIQECAREKKQALLFINRRGYAPAAWCAKCKTSLQCERCAAALTAHKRRRLMLCHWCGFSLPPDSPCAQCGAPLLALGAGTERVEEALRKRFPQARISRLDSDSLAAAGDFARESEAIAEGRRELLVGTQIVAKGHNFPRLSLIGILGADAGLFAPDFRAQERLTAILSQVVGRGTRNPRGCRVMIQTEHPLHPFYKLLLQDDIASGWDLLLAERKRARLPPFSHLALLRASAASQKKLYAFLNAAQKKARATKPKTVAIGSPVPALRAKIAGKHRAQLLISSESRADLHRFLSAFLPRLPPAPRWQMDIDPLEV